MRRSLRRPGRRRSPISLSPSPRKPRDVEEHVTRKVRELLAAEPSMGYRPLHTRLKEEPGFQKVGKKAVQLAGKKVRKELGVPLSPGPFPASRQPEKADLNGRSSRGSGINMDEALRQVAARKAMAKKILAQGSLAGSLLGRGKGFGRGFAKKGACSNVSENKPARFNDTLWEEPRVAVGLPLIGDTSPGRRWTYPLRDESRRSYAGLLQCPFLPEQCAKFFSQVHDGTEWKQPDGPHGPIPRKTAWMVASGCTCSYRYGQIEVGAQEFPPWMIELMHIAMPCCGLSEPSKWPNSCNLNLYEDGGMSVGWHADDERLFQGKFRDVRIISLSLGARRSFELRPNWPEEGEKSMYRLFLGSGDMLTMEGMTQKHYQHRVPKEDGVGGPRINLTWRWVAKHAPQCPADRQRLA